MPHQCVRCNTFYDDGSQEILNGCKCGGKLFFYIKKERLDEAKNLTKNGSYYDISFDLERGECIGFFGPAGSGKSELIKTVAGLNSYDKGILFILKKEAKSREPAYFRLARNVGYFSGDTTNELLHDWPLTKNISILNIAKVVGKFIRIIKFSAEKRMAFPFKVRDIAIRRPHLLYPAVFHSNIR